MSTETIIQTPSTSNLIKFDSSLETNPKSFQEQLREKDEQLREKDEEIAEIKRQLKESEKNRLIDPLTGCYSKNPGWILPHTLTQMTANSVNVVN